MPFCVKRSKAYSRYWRMARSINRGSKNQLTTSISTSAASTASVMAALLASGHAPAAPDMVSMSCCMTNEMTRLTHVSSSEEAAVMAKLSRLPA